jgi:Type II secretion system (T2SS), protein G
VVLSAVGALLTFLEVIGVMVYMRGSKVMTDAQVASARQDLAKIVVALEDYRSKKGDYPPDLQTLVGKPIPTRFLNITDHSSGLFHVDPYHYEIHEDGTYVVFAVGPDGQAGTADDVRPELSDSLAEHSGYHPLDSKRPH